MPVHDPFVQPVAHSMQVMLCRMVSGQATPQEAEAMYPGQSCQEQEGKPDIVGGQWLRQNGKQGIHLTDLPDS